MERRHQVFISSSALDLKEERAAVVQTLLHHNAIPAGMELFPAADDDAWTLIRRIIDDSDYYLLVLGGIYGSMLRDTKHSYTEQEYDYAVLLGKPVMAFLHRNPDKIELGKSEKSELGRDKLNAFRAKVESQKHVKYWETASDLAACVAVSYPGFRESYPADGWVRGSLQTPVAAFGEVEALKRKTIDLEGQLRETETALSALDPKRLMLVAQHTHYRPIATTSVRLNDGSIVEVDGLEVGAVTWNDLFIALGPYIANECSTTDLRVVLGTWWTKREEEILEQSAREFTQEMDEAMAEIILSRIFVSIQDTRSILSQFHGLGMIRPTGSVTARGAHVWTLTVLGKQHLMSLVAAHDNRLDPMQSVVLSH
jgi:hypothetical protein